MRSLTVFLLVGILGFTLLNPQCNCHANEIIMESPVYSKPQKSLIQRFKEATGRVYQESSKDAVEPLKTLPDAKELQCLRDNIYFESRGESEAGQRAVANVILNRMNNKKFPNTLCGVTYQRKQFSWTNDKNSNIPRKGDALNRAERIAKTVWYHNQLNLDNTNGKLFFNTTHMSGQKIGRHYFY